MKRLHEALEILLKYEDGSVSADHEVIYLGGPDPKDITPEDADRLKALRVHFNQSAQSWMLFV